MSSRLRITTAGAAELCVVTQQSLMACVCVFLNCIHLGSTKVASSEQTGSLTVSLVLTRADAVVSSTPLADLERAAPWNSDSKVLQQQSRIWTVCLVMWGTR